MIRALSKANNSGRQTLGFSSGQMLRSNLILSKPLPLPLGVIFSEWKDRQGPGRFQRWAHRAAARGRNSSAGEHHSPSSCGCRESSGLCTSLKHAHACMCTHQNKPVLSCLPGRLRLQDPQPAIAFKPLCLRVPYPCLPPSFLSTEPEKYSPSPPTLPSTWHKKQKLTQARLRSWAVSGRTHTHGSAMGTRRSAGSAKAPAGVRGSRRSRARSLFFFLSLLLSALLERKRKKDYSSFSIKWKD